MASNGSVCAGFDEMLMRGRPIPCVPNGASCLSVNERTVPPSYPNASLDSKMAVAGYLRVGPSTAHPVDVLDSSAAVTL